MLYVVDHGIMVDLTITAHFRRHSPRSTIGCRLQPLELLPVAARHIGVGGCAGDWPAKSLLMRRASNLFCCVSVVSCAFGLCAFVV